MNIERQNTEMALRLSSYVINSAINSVNSVGKLRKLYHKDIWFFC